MVLVRGGFRMVAHAQRWADEVTAATGARDHGTYPSHSPTPERAIDTFVPKYPRDLGDSVCAFSLRNWRRLGVRYMIWRQRINWNDGLGWKDMEDRGNDTQNHFDHTHTAFQTTAEGGAPAPPAERRYMPGTELVSLGLPDGLVLDLDVATALVNGKPARGGRVIVWPDRGGANQTWNFEMVDQQWFKIRVALDSHRHFVLDNDPASQIVHLYDDLNVTQQQWRFVHHAHHVVQIVNRGTGRVLDVEANGPRGARVIAYADNRQSNQMWVRKANAG